MRIGYSEDEEYPGQFNLWQANCARSLAGRGGQAALRELEVALLALPEKRLIANKLQSPEGEVCALGALAKYKGREMAPAAENENDWDEFGQDEEMEEFGVSLGMPRLVAWKVVCLNDVELDGSTLVIHQGPYRWPAERPHAYVPVTPEVRYEKVLAWVRKQLTGSVQH